MAFINLQIDSYNAILYINILNTIIVLNYVVLLFIIIV